MKDDQIFLRHILDAIEIIDGYVSNTDRDGFMNNRMLQDAVMRQLAVIGEAANRVSEEFRSAHRALPFVKTIGLRNRLIHAYIDVDLAIVWETCKDDLPPLRKTIQSSLQK